jgi:hypothetical protein
MDWNCSSPPCYKPMKYVEIHSRHLLIPGCPTVTHLMQAAEGQKIRLSVCSPRMITYPCVEWRRCLGVPQFSIWGSFDACGNIADSETSPTAPS